MYSCPVLTHDAERLALSMYRRYKDRIRQGESRVNARYFGGPESVSKMLPNYHVTDVSDLIWEIESIGFASVTPGDDLFYECSLTSSCIAWAENRLKNGIKETANALISIL